MSKDEKNLLAIYLNEFNFNFLYVGAKKYKCKNILKYLNLPRTKTFTKDTEQNYNLDPWVQAVSISTGTNSKSHKIYKLGQPVKKINQIWDYLSAKNISCSVWGAINSKFKNHRLLFHYFPDPWNFEDKPKPINLKNLYLLPNYYAKNYLKINTFKFLYFAFFFIFSLFKNSRLLDTMGDILFAIKIILKKGFKNYILFFLFDIFFMNVVIKHSKQKKSDFTMIFLNSIAHFQHNNWNENENNKVFFECVERIFKKIENIKTQYKSLAIFNGFSQKKIKREYLLRPIDPYFFLSNFIEFKSLEQDMTNGGFIFFKNKKEMLSGFKKLNKLYCFKKKIFETAKYSDLVIFYKINLKSNQILSRKSKSSNLTEIRKNNFIHNKKIIDISNFFISNIKCIKTTGVHTQEGIFLYKNLHIMPKPHKIENHKIFKYIIEHFHK